LGGIEVKANRVSLFALILLVLHESRIWSQQFGHEPFGHVQDAATNHANDFCSSPTPSPLTNYKLMAYLLAPTWPETTGGDLTLTPSPMTLGRNDHSDNFFMPGQNQYGMPYYRAFWHPGIGPWQIDDLGFASDLGMERFDTLHSADRAAKKMATLYCGCANQAQCAAAVFSQWGCGSSGTICEQNYQTIVNPSGPPTITEDYSVDSLGGSEVRTCSVAGTLVAFPCFYVDTARAEGAASSWTGDPNGLTGLSPLAKPFYVYSQPLGGTSYEWRYWSAVDGGFPKDVRAGRVLGHDSRNGLWWTTYSAPAGEGLCDLSRPHGDACLGQYRSDGATAILVGGGTDESTVKFRALMIDPGGQQSRLEVELRQLKENGGTFNGTPIQKSPMVASGTVAEATANGLLKGYYHWRARTVNAAGQESPWQSFGGNPDGATDFTVGHGGTLEVKATLDGSPWSGPVSYSVSGAASFTGGFAATYLNLPEGGYTVLYVSGGPANTSYRNIVPAASQFLPIGGTISWTLQFTTNRGPFCSTNSGASLQSTTSATCGGRLSVTLAGSGNGRVVSNPSGIDCSVGTCSTSFAAGTQVVLSTNPALGSTFAGWSGDPACTSGTVTMNGNHACTATFTTTASSYTLSVAETGSGTITSSDGGISCGGGTCTQTYLAGTPVTLTASAASGWSFSSWFGVCAGSGPVVHLVMNNNLACTANFTQNPQPAPVTTTGAATNITDSSATLNGTINPENFAATAFFEYGPDPNLGNATPSVAFGPGNNAFFPYSETVTGLACATNYRFRAVGVGAGGDYRASNNYFTTAQCPPAPCYALNLIPNGDAPVPTSSPTNASGCPFGQFHAGDHIALIVPVIPGDIVTGWGGTDNDSSTSSANTVTMNFPYNRAVYVIEQHICYHLTLGYTGRGAIPTVTNPVAYCPTDYFPWGYEVDVSGASPATGWQIGGWSGTEYDYSQLDHNFILMPQQSTTALVQYIPIQYPLSVTKIGNGSGTVTSDVPGIDCGATCSSYYPYGTTVTLSATPDPGSIFLGFSGGACNGGVPTMTANTTCTAVFGLAPPNTGTNFYTLSPCRVVDTRTSHSPILSGFASPRSFQIAGFCRIPASAQAVAANVTVVNPTQPGYVTLFPADQAWPTASTLTFQIGQVRANNAILPLSADGRLAAILGPAVGGQVDLVVDVSGYFDAGSSGALPTFAPKYDLTTGTEPLGLVVADLDGDHRNDIAVTIYNNGAGDHLTIFRNTGTNGQLQFDSVDVPTGRGPEGLAVGDLDNDGKVDLVSVNPGDSSISVLRNLSTQGILDFEPVPFSLSSPPTPHQVVITDFDGDGKPDIIMTSNIGRIVSVFHHASDPNTIAFDYRRDFPTEGFLNLLAVADLDRDMRPDILVPIEDTSHLSILQNISSPGNVQASALPLLATGTSPKGIAVGDLNNDQLPDVVVSANGGLGIFTNGSSQGVFSLPRTDVAMGTTPEAATIGDLDKDGFSDVVVANPSESTLTLFHNTTGTPGAAISLTDLQTPLAIGLAPINIVLGDVDGDGWLDIVVANHMTGSVSIFLNTTGRQ
jgi:hypothetical protein